MSSIGVFNLDAVRRNEEAIYRVVAEAVRKLCLEGWNASAIRVPLPPYMTPRQTGQTGAGPHPGYVVGLRVEVESDDPRIEWQPFGGRPSEAGKRFEGTYPAGFEWSPGRDGKVMLLSGIEDGSGSQVAQFVDRLQGKQMALFVQHLPEDSAAEDLPDEDRYGKAQRCRGG